MLCLSWVVEAIYLGRVARGVMEGEMWWHNHSLKERQ